MNWGLFKIIYQHTGEIGRGSGWHEDEFFIFLGTVWIINSLIQTFFMANAEEFSELIRTGNLDFALLKPIDTQFLISFVRINWSQIPNGILGVVLICYSVRNLMISPDKEGYFSLMGLLACLPAFVFFVLCGAVVMYSVMIILSSTSIWFGRNQNLYSLLVLHHEFFTGTQWKSINETGSGWRFWCTFTFVVPILVVSNVPARILAQPLGSPWKAWEWGLAAFAVVAAIWSLIASRWVFRRALLSYRSASS